MITLTVLYGHPQDTSAFDRHYQQTHIPLVHKLPGLKGFVIQKPQALNPQETFPYYLIANLYWENMQAFQDALQSSAGQAATADVQTFATGGATLLVGEQQVIVPVSLG